MKTIQLDFGYDASAQRLYELFTDREFLAAQIAAAGGTEVEILEREVSADCARVVWRSRKEVEVPGFAKSVVPSTNRITQTDTWRRDADGYQCAWSAKISGAPANTFGSMSVEPDDAVSRYTFVGHIKIKVPLIGGKLEGQGLDQMIDEIRSRDAFTRSYLTGHP